MPSIDNPSRILAALRICGDREFDAARVLLQIALESDPATAKSAWREAIGRLADGVDSAIAVYVEAAGAQTG